MNFGDLQKARQQRLTSHPTRTSQEILPNEDKRVSPEDVRSVASKNETPDLVKITSGMFKDLPPNIEIRTERSLGRGLYVSKSAGDGYSAGARTDC